MHIAPGKTYYIFNCIQYFCINSQHKLNVYCHLGKKCVLLYKITPNFSESGFLIDEQEDSPSTCLNFL